MPYNPLIGACSGLPPHLHVSVSQESSGASAKIKPSVSLITGGSQPHHVPQRRFHNASSTTQVLQRRFYNAGSTMHVNNTRANAVTHLHVSVSCLVTTCASEKIKPVGRLILGPQLFKSTSTHKPAKRITWRLGAAPHALALRLDGLQAAMLQRFSLASLLNPGVPIMLKNILP